MKKLFSALILTSLLAIPIVVFAAAGDTCLEYETKTACEGSVEFSCFWVRTSDTNVNEGNCYGTSVTGVSGLIDLINKIGTWIFAALLGLAGIFLVVAGFFFVTSGGNPEQSGKANKMLINALIGVAIGLGAKGLIAVVTGLLS